VVRPVVAVPVPVRVFVPVVVRAVVPAVVFPVVPVAVRLLAFGAVPV
jgi:hypothetical protein